MKITSKLLEEYDLFRTNAIKHLSSNLKILDKLHINYNIQYEVGALSNDLVKWKDDNKDRLTSDEKAIIYDNVFDLNRLKYDVEIQARKRMSLKEGIDVIRIKSLLSDAKYPDVTTLTIPESLSRYEIVFMTALVTGWDYSRDHKGLTFTRTQVDL